MSATASAVDAGDALTDALAEIDALRKALAERDAGEAERVREAVAREREACAQQIAGFFSDDAHKGHILAQYLRARATSPAPEPAPCVGCEKAAESLAGWRSEVTRLRDVIRTGEAMLRAERAILGVPGGIDAAPDQDADGASHDLKTWPGPFDAIVDGRKRYEIRRFDRSFAVGDRLVLREWNPVREDYTGRVIAVRVSYLTAPGNWGLPDDVGVLGIVVDRAERDTASTVDKLADAAALAELEAAARNLLACATAPEPVAAGRVATDAAKAARARGEDVYADGEGRAVVEAAVEWRASLDGPGECWHEARMREAVDALAAARKGGG